MTLEQIILYPLTHRIMTLDEFAELEQLRRMGRAPLVAPVKAKRAYVRKAKA
jgi:hypothetical protein